MKTIINNKGIETIIFAETFEFEAYDQIKKLVNFEAYENAKVRIMPDAHAGKGCTVGTTMTITDKVTPNLVGVDIGCGMLTVKLKDKEIDFEKLDEIIKSKIPNGFGVHEKAKNKFDFTNLRCQNHVDLSRAMLSIGSLGGGNHFIEVGKDELTDDLYLIIHSGSRKLGGEVCKYYQNLAIGADKKIIRKAVIDKLKSEGRSSEINKELEKIKPSNNDKDLAYLTGADFEDYMNDMAIVQKFATLNRETMAEIILKEAGLQEVNRFETIHNYIDFKRMILRKGAVSAENGERILIPINMRDGSLLCIGKGNEDWNYSAPHGAGRLMSRSKAKEAINLDEFIDSMKGIHFLSRSWDIR
jgi:RNA-splicing ligase RtcB